MFTSLHRPPYTRLKRTPVWRLVVVALTLASLGAFAIHPTAADDLSDKQNQRNQVAASIAQIKAQIATAKNQEAALQAIIVGLDAQIATTEQSINAAQAKLLTINAQLADAQDHLQQVKDQLTTDKKALAHQMVMVYEMGSQSTTLTNIIGAADFNQFVEQVNAARRIASSQNTLTVKVVGEEADVQVTVDKIAIQKAQQQQLLAQLHTAATALDYQLGTEQQARAYLVQVQAADQARLLEAEHAQALLDQEIAQLQAEQAAAAAHGGGNGHFVWPEAGPISQGFGCSPYYFEPFDPNCPSRHFHSGLDIAAACYTPLHAADAGIVNTFYSGYGYGNHIIMIHGNGWSTLYGHMASFIVSNGQAVARGQVIGYEGSTGNSTGCHLHFEVRWNNSPRDPLQYLP